MKVLYIYCDRKSKNDLIVETIGDRFFGDVLFQKERVEDRYKKNVLSSFSDVTWVRVIEGFHIEELLPLLKKIDDNTKVIFSYSDYIVCDAEKFNLSIQKALYIEENYVGYIDGEPALWMFKNIKSFVKYYENGKKYECDDFQMQGLCCINDYESFVGFVTGNLDTRFFNHISGDDYLLSKSSTNKKKIYAEYCFYKLLPEDMQHWFVQPFDYKEYDDRASYSMERLHMTDLSIKWVHGSISEEEFNDLLDLYFCFFSSRHIKKCSIEEYKRCSDSLYVTKVYDRIEQLKKLQEYKKISEFLSIIDISLDDLVERYLRLKDNYEKRINIKPQLVIGHGDPCFSNALYNKHSKMLRFIDPKGATKEDELWTDFYYDFAKLSHSICGGYHFINNKLDDIKIIDNYSAQLVFPYDLNHFKELFKSKLSSEGIDYNLVRIYESSLFLSMLPLHIDSPLKVIAFIINARNIIEELERNL